MHWAVDNYHSEGLRKTAFLTEDVIKYHRTLSTYIDGLINCGFQIQSVKESKPSESIACNDPNVVDEFRRPMFLIVSAQK